jgi:hypothetical protein
MSVYRILALATLVLHLAWLAWVLCGWLLTRGRPVLRWLHIASLFYEILISVAGWVCPLTHAEQYFRSRAGGASYEQSFLEHYVEAAVYPDVPAALLMWGGVVVCAGILGVYIARFRRRDAREGW